MNSLKTQIRSICVASYQFQILVKIMGLTSPAREGLAVFSNFQIFKFSNFHANFGHSLIF